MTQNLEKPPIEGTRRERFFADARAEARWRRHEIAGRLSAIQSDAKRIAKEASALLKIAVKALTKDPKVFDAKEILGELPPGNPKRKRRGKK